MSWFRLATALSCAITFPGLFWVLLVVLP